MTQKELQAKYDRLVDKTIRMRGWQQRWHKYHIGKEYDYMMRSQREVDQILREEIKIQKANQQEISFTNVHTQSGTA